jgi:hypothetical protein
VPWSGITSGSFLPNHGKNDGIVLHVVNPQALAGDSFPHRSGFEGDSLASLVVQRGDDLDPLEFELLEREVRCQPRRGFVSSRSASPALTATTASSLISGQKAKTTPRMTSDWPRWKRPGIRWSASS